jgi:hypothetical protein
MWYHELVAMGYKEPLLLPIPGVQATLSAIQPPEIHAYVQKRTGKRLRLQTVRIRRSCW